MTRSHPARSNRIPHATRWLTVEMRNPEQRLIAHLVRVSSKSFPNPSICELRPVLTCGARRSFERTPSGYRGVSWMLSPAPASCPRRRAVRRTRGGDRSSPGAARGGRPSRMFDGEGPPRGSPRNRLARVAWPSTLRRMRALSGRDRSHRERRESPVPRITFLRVHECHHVLDPGCLTYPSGTSPVTWGSVGPVIRHLQCRARQGGVVHLLPTRVQSRSASTAYNPSRINRPADRYRSTGSIVGWSDGVASTVIEWAPRVSTPNGWLWHARDSGGTSAHRSPDRAVRHERPCR